MSRVFRSFLSVIVVTCLAGTAFAQAPGGSRPRGGMGPMMGGPTNESLMLLRLEAVQKDLDLVDDQKAKLKDLGEKTQAAMREMFSGMRDLSQEERQAKMEELRTKAKAREEESGKKIDEILLPQQTERLKEIRIQVQGIRALRDVDVLKALGLDAAQKEKLQAIEKDVRDQMEKTFAGLRDLSQEERRAKATELREKFQKTEKEVADKMLGVLTAEQKEKFEKMKGKKIEVDLSQLMQRPPRPQPQQ